MDQQVDSRPVEMGFLNQVRVVEVDMVVDMEVVVNLVEVSHRQT